MPQQSCRFGRLLLRGDELRPFVHERPTLLQQILAVVGAHGLVLDGVRQGPLHHVESMRGVRASSRAAFIRLSSASIAPLDSGLPFLAPGNTKPLPAVAAFCMARISSARLPS